MSKVREVRISFTTGPATVIDFTKANKEEKTAYILASNQIYCTSESIDFKDVINTVRQLIGWTVEVGRSGNIPTAHIFEMIDEEVQAIKKVADLDLYGKDFEKRFIQNYVFQEVMTNPAYKEAAVLLNTSAKEMFKKLEEKNLPKSDGIIH